MPETKRLRKIFAFVLLCLPAVASAQSLSEDIEFLTAPCCNGRACGTAGGAVAARHIAVAFRNAGLEVTGHTFASGNSTGHNIVGEIPGPGRPVVILARYDGLGAAEQEGSYYPGADSNASGAAAMLTLARMLRDSGRHIIFVAVDGDGATQAGGSAAFAALRGTRPRAVVTLDAIGSSLVPPVPSKPRYVIAVGGSAWRKTIDAAALKEDVAVSYDYYGSPGFTRYFFEKKASHREFLKAGYPCVLFTSGVTLHTNKTSDLPSTLDFDLLEARIRIVRDLVLKLQ